ncbi:Uu.00g087560.m01.CDS01 [Anthostomella pinea]|uniref:Uu.00g087560.m01.CDS01 n=1 Tax=Anthostomella pinea TaxID=933095 RepID=A0AAI8VNI3_9PEZI|nr:Uu.00g087560.m01.CDS01 [Anthostomella pinea]
MADTKKSIIVLGGSYAGVSIAHNLLKHAIPNLPSKESYEVVLISTTSQAMCRPACPRALISDDLFDQSRLFVSIPEQFKQYGANFRFIQGTATELDHSARVITFDLKAGGTEKLPFHALVIATGAATASPLLGFTGDEDGLRASWAEFRKALPAAKSIVVAGGGPTGVETAGELGEHLNGRAGYLSSKLENPKVPITLVTAGSELLPILRTSLARKAEDMLTKVGVTVVKNARVTAVAPEHAGTGTVAAKTTVTLSTGKTLEADLYIPGCGTTPNTGFLSKDLLAADGRVDTNAATLRVDKAGPRIYAIGDVANYARPAVHLILAAVPVLAVNIKKDLLLDAGKDKAAVGEDRVYKEDTKETQMVPIGKSKGVGAGGGFALPSFMVWLIKGRDYWLWTVGKLWSGQQWNKEG